MYDLIYPQLEHILFLDLIYVPRFDAHHNISQYDLSMITSLEKKQHCLLYPSFWTASCLNAAEHRKR